MRSVDFLREWSNPQHKSGGGELLGFLPLWDSSID